MSRSATTPLPEDLRAWVERETGGVVAFSRAHHAGASRSAWTVDVDVDVRIADASSRRALFVLQDKRDGGGSARDATVLRALSGHGVPVPDVVAASGAHAAILLSRLPGRSDFPADDEPAERREQVAAHLMALTARLHALEPKDLDIAHLTPPGRPEDCARGTLAQARGAADALGEAADPFYPLALGWLDAHVPSSVDRYSLVHSDMGPGNFLYEDGHVTGIVDWEVAHFGDPMEDLAAIAIRDMATPVGSLARRFDEYAASGGAEVDLARVHYYRLLVLVRNSLMIGLGLAHPAASMDVEEMTLYQTLLVRAAALVLCDNLGIARPEPPSPARDAAPAEREEAAALLGRASSSFTDEAEVDAALRRAIAVDAPLDGERLADFARFFARRMHRLAARRKSLLGPLFERRPQPLVAP